ncbi:MAG TPA: hypothetical protein VFE47_06845 [Tepidisphaeraceae bacterium]|jgi:hypothetical protein|nr:hypothetical protein [Tepidisphaeraceae bacterium]
METMELLPPMPKIGRPEEYYASKIRHADQGREVHLRESLKVAQYISLALGAGISWPKKERYFEHAIHRHCQPPLEASDAVVEFYNKLKDLVQLHAGEEASTLCCRQDDLFCERLSKGEPRSEVKVDAITFFNTVLGDLHRTPDHFHYDDWHQIMVMRNGWI